MLRGKCRDRFCGLVAFVALIVCSTIARARTEKSSFEVNLPGRPFGVVASQDQEWIFVSLARDSDAQSPGIAVLLNQGGRIELVRKIPLSHSPSGIALTHKGDILIAAADEEIIFFDTQRLETGGDKPAFQWVNAGSKAGCVEVNVTADDSTVFVSDERAQTITVIALERIRALGRDSAANLNRIDSPVGASLAIVGKIRVGIAPIALVFSQDGRWLFTTSEVAPESWGWPRVLKREGNRPDREMVPEGAVVVIDVEKAKTAPRDAVVGKVAAGGSPVRLALSPDGGRVFVTARNSNAVLVFETAQLTNDPEHARPIKIPVGSSPVPIVLVDHGRFALVGNSNRFAADATKNSSLTVIDTSRVGTGLDPVLGSLPCGSFPRNFHLTSDGRTLFLTNFRSGTLQVYDVDRLRLNIVK